MKEFQKGLAKYNGLKNKSEQYLKFRKIICIHKGNIVYEKSH